MKAVVLCFKPYLKTEELKSYGIIYLYVIEIKRKSRSFRSGLLTKMRQICLSAPGGTTYGYASVFPLPF